MSEPDLVITMSNLDELEDVGPVERHDIRNALEKGHETEVFIYHEGPTYHDDGSIDMFRTRFVVYPKSGNGTASDNGDPVPFDCRDIDDLMAQWDEARKPYIAE